MDLNKLEELARAATPGPWVTEEVFAENGAFSHISMTSEDGTELIGDDLGPSHVDTAFIAAANPAAVQELIDLARKQAARISELTEVTGDQYMRLDAVLLVQAGLVEALQFTLPLAEELGRNFGANPDSNPDIIKARAALQHAGVTL